MRVGVVGLRESVPARGMTVPERIKGQGQYLCAHIFSLGGLYVIPAVKPATS